MRWRYEPPKWGDKREMSGFLLFPRTIGGETRWLERGKWEEMYEIGAWDGEWNYLRWLS